MKHALYAGSFDPFTNGHLDILLQASELFDKITVAVASNSSKQPFIPVLDRVKLIKKIAAHIKNVDVTSYSGLTVSYAAKIGANTLIRGIRNTKDYDYEYAVAQTNKSLDAAINTVFFVPSQQNGCISSTVIRELVINSADIKNFVPKEVAEYFEKQKG